ncbi:MAG: LamG-like jellyroll fold domain-containing protein [Planctomycetota bacterium]|jgi:hypothetical protein
MPRLFLLTGLVVFSASVQAQNILYYPFLRGTGTTVQNLWAGTTSPAPAFGTIVSTNTKQWVPGRIGLALSGRESTSKENYINTGWKAVLNPLSPILTGDFTIAWFIKKRINPPSASYMFGNIGSFRCFTAGVANNGIYLRAWGGSTPTDLILPDSSKPGGYDIQGGATGKWLHVAIVVDSNAGKATWYIDGMPQHVITITGSARVMPSNSAFEFRVGKHTSTVASPFDIDEFRVLNRAAAPFEILNWSLAKLRVDVDKISQSQAGSQTFTVDVGSQHSTRLYWLFSSLTGTSPATNISGIQIPLVVDAWTSLALGLTNTPLLSGYRGVLDTNGRGSATLNMPKGWNDPNGIGIKIYHAATVFDSSRIYLATNPVDVQIIK